MWSLDLTHPGSERPYDYSKIANQDYGSMGDGHVDSVSSSNLVASIGDFKTCAINIDNRVESLNISNSGAIVFHHLSYLKKRVD